MATHDNGKYQMSHQSNKKLAQIECDECWHHWKPKSHIRNMTYGGWGVYQDKSIYLSYIFRLDQWNALNYLRSLQIDAHVGHQVLLPTAQISLSFGGAILSNSLAVVLFATSRCGHFRDSFVWHSFVCRQKDTIIARRKKWHPIKRPWYAAEFAA